jgi:hypothetical protein
VPCIAHGGEISNKISAKAIMVAVGYRHSSSALKAFMALLIKVYKWQIQVTYRN